MTKKIDDIEVYYYNNVRLSTGEKIINVNRSIKCETDWSKYVESLANNNHKKTYLWLRYTKTTHPIFERLIPILSNWNKFDKEMFMSKGTLLASHKHLVPGYPVGISQRMVCNHKPPLDIVWEDENIMTVEC